MDCPFQVGQKVVWVGGVNLPGYGGPGNGVTHPVRCGIYTVRDITLCPLNAHPLIRVSEIVNPIGGAGGIYASPWGKWELAWAWENFRPLKDIEQEAATKTDISIFKKILAEAGKEIDETVT